MNSFIRENGGAKLDRRYQLASDATTVAQNGVLVPSAKVIGGVNIITSTGSLGPYTINFSPIVFVNAPIVAAWCSQESGGNGVIVNLSAIGTTSFAFFMAIPGVGIITSTHTVTVEWIAVGA